MPVVQQVYIARMYILLTTENNADFALDSTEALQRFKNLVNKNDFPVRILSRLMVVCSMVDFILINRPFLDGMAKEFEFNEAGGKKILDISDKQWQKAMASWREVRSTRLTHGAFHRWVRETASRISPNNYQ